MKAASGSSNIAAMGVLTDVKKAIALVAHRDWWEADTSKNKF